MLAARANFTATLLQNGKVLIVGGVADMTVAGTATTRVEIFDPSTRRFSIAASLAFARAGHTATLLSSGKVLVAGGYSQLGSAALNSVETYDPVSGAWTLSIPMHHGRTGHAAVLLPGGKVLVTGGSGYPPVGISPGARSVAPTFPPEAYDPTAHSWSTVAVPKFDRPVSPNATLLKDGRVLVVGGQYFWNSPDELSETSEIYDAASNRWATVPAESLSGARQFSSSTLLPGGQVLVAGGTRDLQPIGSAFTFDANRNAWIQQPNMNEARCGQEAQLLKTGRVLMVGSGCTTSSLGASSAVEEFDPGTSRWYRVASLASARGMVVTVMLPDGNVLALGGYHVAGVASAAADVFNPR
jgi:hypothetical protein